MSDGENGNCYTDEEKKKETLEVSWKKGWVGWYKSKSIRIKINDKSYKVSSIKVNEKIDKDKKGYSYKLNDDMVEFSFCGSLHKKIYDVLYNSMKNKKVLELGNKITMYHEKRKNNPILSVSLISKFFNGKFPIELQVNILSFLDVSLMKSKCLNFISRPQNFSKFVSDLKRIYGNLTQNYDCGLNSKNK